jgi:hypothetical protein
MTAMTSFARAFGLGLLLAGVAVAGWQEEERITERTTQSDRTTLNNARSVAADGSGNIHVVWYGADSGVYQVWYSRYDAQLRTWSVDTVVSVDTNGAYYPAIAVDDSGKVHLVWQAGQSGVAIMYRCRGVAGEWDQVESVTSGTGVEHPSVAVRASGFVAAAWEGQYSRPAKGVFASFRDAAGWHSPESVSDSGQPGASVQASVGTDDAGEIAVAWSYSSVADKFVLFRSTNGRDWGSIDTVGVGYQCVRPCLVLERSGVANVAWRQTDSTGQAQKIAFRKCTSGRWSVMTWLPAVHLQADPPSVAVDQAGRPHVAWCSPDSVGRPQVFWISSDTSGTNWSVPFRLTTAASVRENPSIGRGPGGQIQVVWTDYRHDPIHPDVYCRRYDALHDVGVTRIEQPTGVLDSGTAVQPAAWVKNYGDFPESGVPVWLRFGGYQNQQMTGSLAQGDSALLSFDSATVVVRGLNVATCSTALPGDSDPANDTVRGTFFVRVLDVGAVRIDSPSATVDSGVAVTPRVWVRNQGTGTVSFPVMFLIDGEYADTKTVAALNPGDSILVSFANWTPAHRGTLGMRCTTGLTGDRIPANDTVGGSVTVRVRDVGTACIVSPIGEPDSGTVATPACSLYNYGGQSETYKVRLRIGSYEDSVVVSDHAAGTGRLVVFPDWTATARGWQSVRCSTMLDRDRNSGNDMQSCSVFVRVIDAAPVEILSPAEIISRGEVRPRVRLVNWGNEAASVPARFEILGDTGRVYVDSIIVAVGPGDTAEAEFPPWTAQSGIYVGACSTASAGDMQPGNDTMRCRFRVVRVDAAALAIRFPLDTISEGRIEPRVLVANYGDDPATFYAHFMCKRQGSVVYCDSEFVSLDSMSEKEVTFREWKAGPGDYSLLATVALGDDSNPHNDSVSAAVHVESLDSRHWTERAPVPRGPWRRPVKDGGCLVSVEDGLLALKGANTREWYRYAATADSWATLEDVPAGADGHKVKSGAALCWDGNGAVFALKGNNTREFWRYDIPGDSWYQLAGLPEYTMRVKYGSGLVFVSVEDTDKVFMVKGSNTRDFLVYWVRQNEWHASRPLPPGPDSATARHGTCLAELGGRIFCLKGRTTEFYEYFPDGDSWVERADLPRLGYGNQWKKSAKGAALTSDGNRFLYAFKGGRSNELWCYDTRGDSWTQLDDIPGGNRRRRVGNGGALAWLGGRAYALKGGGSNEFWRFDPLAVGAETPELVRGAGVEADVLALPVTRPAPVLVRCGRPAQYPVPEGSSTILVIDASGRAVTRRSVASPTVELRFSRPGVYLVLTAGSFGSVAAKTVVVP